MIIYQNLRSLITKLRKVLQNTIDTNHIEFDVFIFTETWFIDLIYCIVLFDNNFFFRCD